MPRFLLELLASVTVWAGAARAAATVPDRVIRGQARTRRSGRPTRSSRSSSFSSPTSRRQFADLAKEPTP